MINLPNSNELLLSKNNWKSHALHFKDAALILVDAKIKSSTIINNKTGCTIDDPELQLAHLAIHTRLPCMMCMGLSIEMLLKALSLSKGKFSQDAAGKISFIGAGANGHNLKGMCDVLSVTLSKDEQNVVDRLADVIVWGKYPGPRTPHEYEHPFYSTINGNSKPFHPHRGWDIQLFVNIYTNLFNRIISEI